MISNDVIQGIKLVNETFTISEAREILSGIIDKQINYYKLQQFSEWVKNHAADSYSFDEKIRELEENKHELMEMIAEAKKNHMKVHLNCQLEMDIVYEEEFSLQQSA